MKIVLKAVKEHVKEYFRIRIQEESKSLIAVWKSEKIYPYEGEAASENEIIERQVFDIVALNVNEFLPDFESSNSVSKKFSLQLIKEALGRNPRSLRHILESVLELPADKILELDELLNVTTLSNMITTSRCVADRLTFLNGLRLLIYENKEQVLERSQLHKILALNTWVFGEEFFLSVSDKSLNAVLKAHIKLLGRDELAPEAPVSIEGKTRGIVDLMLSRQIKGDRPAKFKHLIVELKRPSQKIDLDVKKQIEEYAFAVVDDERFAGTDTEWFFIAISNEISSAVQKFAKQTSLPEGVTYQGSNITIMVMTWAQILRNCSARLEFFQEKLRFEPDNELSIKYLQEKYKEFIPSTLNA